MRTSTLAWVSKYSYYYVHTTATTTMTTGTNAVVVHVHVSRRCMNTKNPIPLIRHHHTNKEEAAADPVVIIFRITSRRRKGIGTVSCRIPLLLCVATVWLQYWWGMLEVWS